MSESEFCPWCGSSTRSSHSFCRSCGQKLPTTTLGAVAAAPGPSTRPPPTASAPPLLANNSRGTARAPQLHPAPATSNAPVPLVSQPAITWARSNARVWVPVVIAAVVVVLLIAYATEPAADSGTPSSTTSPGGSPGSGTNGGGSNAPTLTVSSVTVNFSYPYGSAQFFGPGNLNACESSCPAFFPNAQVCNSSAPVEVIGSVEITNQGSQIHAIDSVTVSPFNGGGYGEVSWYVVFLNSESQGMATPYYVDPGATLPYSTVFLELQGACDSVSGTSAVTITLGVS
jgi:hypothetical protein